MSLSTFSPSKRLQNEQSLPFLSFSNFKALKSPHFCQNSSLSTFSPSGGFSKMSKVCLWWLFELQGLQAVRASNFVKRGLWVRFHQAGGLQNEQSLRFWVFQALELLKASNFVKRGLWVHFHQAGGLQNEQSLHFQAFQALKSSLLSKEVFGYVLTKRTAYKMNKVCPFRDFQASGHSTTCCQNIFK